MKIAIMQPYFLPYIGYFSLFEKVDKFILLDDVQFQRKSWMTRNRIINLNGGSTYINLPTKKAPLDSLIKEIKVNNEENWRLKLENQLQIYQKAPYYKKVNEFLLDTLSGCNSESLVETNYRILMGVLNYLHIDCEVDIFSEMGLHIAPVNAADEWALNITKAMNATEYYNPPGGVNIFDKQKYVDNNIELIFLKNKLNPYQQFNGDFNPGLSIVDVMMFNDVEKIKTLLNDTEVLR